MPVRRTDQSMVAVVVVGVGLMLALTVSVHVASGRVSPPAIGPVVTVAAGDNWTLKAWRSKERGLCVSHVPPASTFCIGGVMRGGRMFTSLSGPTSPFVVSGVVTPVVRRLVLVDTNSRRTLRLYRPPNALKTRLRFFRSIVDPRVVDASQGTKRWKLTAFDSRGRVVSYTGQWP